MKSQADTDDEPENNVLEFPEDPSGTKVGYKNPPTHSRFQPGKSGNPSGRPKGSQNLKSLLHKILKEEVSLREGADVRKVTKAEAIIRGLVVGALKGDPRSLGTLFRLVEQAGEFEEGDPITQIRRVIVTWKAPGAGADTLSINTGVPRAEDFPGNSELKKEPA